MTAVFSRVFGVALVASFLSVTALAQEAEKAGNKKDIQTFSLPEGAKPVDTPPEMMRTAKPAVPMGVRSIKTKSEVMADEKLEAAIASLNELIEMTDEDDPGKPEYLEKLGELYWDKAENFFNRAYGDEIFKEINSAQESGDETALATANAKQADLLKQRAYWQEETTNAYKIVVNNYPTYENLDSALYYLGFTLVQMDRMKDAFPYFARIVRERPTSRYVPDALLNIGEYFFESEDMAQAERMYSEVENFKDSSAYSMAIYKKGWCFYNLGQFDDSMNQFLKVIDYVRSGVATKIGYAEQLLVMAQRDLVMVYSQVGSPENALRVFKAISPAGYMDLAIRLAEGYASQGEYNKSSILYKKIIAEFKGKEDIYKVVQFQRANVENAYKIGIKTKVVEETRRLIGLMDKFKDTAPKDFISSELVKAEELVRVIASNYQKEVTVTKEQATMEFTHHLYNEYLRLFPDSDFVYPMTLNYAYLLKELGKHELAGDRFTAVADIKPEGDLALTAIHEAMSAYYHLSEDLERKTKSEDSNDLEPKELPAFDKKLVTACERYLKIAPPDAADLVEARFAAAMAYYEYNHFREAADLFREITEKASGHANAPDAARLLLSSLALMRDIPGLNAAAETIGASPELMQGDIPTIVKGINERKDFNKCFSVEQEGRYAVAGDCFLAYVERFPDTPLKDRSLINAGTNYFKARLVEKSLKANAQLVNEFPDSPLAAKALFNTADTYRRLAVYSEASRIYEIFVEQYPKHELAEEGLRYATIFRTGLGEYAQAINDLRKYLKLFPKSTYSAGIMIEIGTIYFKQGKFPQAQKEFEDYIKKVGKSGGVDLYLRAHLKIAQSVEKQRKAAKNALGWYEKTVAAYEELTDEDKSKVTVAGLAAVASAQFMKGEAVIDKVKAVKLKLPEKVLAKAIEEKLNLVQSAMTLFNSVEAFGQPNWTIAAYSRKGFGFKDLAESIEGAPVPRGLTVDQQQFYKQGLSEKSLPIWERSKESFRRCVDLARELKWYNQYSAEAEDALMSLDPAFKVLPDFRPSSGFYSLNGGRPSFMAEKEGAETPKWSDDGIENRIRARSEAADAVAEGLYNRAVLALAKGELGEARTWFDKAVGRRPEFANAVAGDGMVYLKEGRLSDAIAKIDAALQLDPANSIANNYYAAKFLKEKDFTQAINYARQALVSDPDSRDAYQILAAAYYELGLYDVGTLVARNAIGLDPTDAPIENMFGLIFLKQGEVRQAVKLIEKSVTDDPENYDSRMNLGAITLSYKDFTTAQAQFQKALDLMPASRDAKLGLAVALRGLGEGEKALALLTDLARDDTYAEVHYNMCLTYQEPLANFKLARIECKKFLDMTDSSHPKRTEVARRLDGIEITIEAMEEEANQPSASEPAIEPAVEPATEPAATPVEPAAGQEDDGKN